MQFYLSAKHLLDFDAAAGLNKIGTIDDVVIDHVVWTLQYLVVRAGRWWNPRRWVVPRRAIKRQIWDTWIEVGMTEKELSHVTAKTPIVGDRWVAARPDEAAESMPIRHPAVGEDDVTEVMVNPDMCSLQEILGYHIAGRDGRLGYVHDFIIEESRWQCAAVVVRSRRWFGRKVLVPVQWMGEVDHEEGTVTSHVGRDAVAGATKAPRGRITENDMKKAFEHYAHVEGTDPLTD